MPTPDAYADGVPCWIDVMTPDRAGATAFYTGLFGWEVLAEGGPETGFYTQFGIGGQVVAGMGQQNEAMAGMPALWTTYLWADDLDATAAKVTEAGGTLMMPPMDVMEFGRMALAMDPTGAVVGFWQPGTHRGATLVNEHGAFTWSEVNTTDVGAAQAFYAAVAGYSFGDSAQVPGYNAISCAGREVGGVMDMATMGMEGVPPHWAVYFGVDDADAAAARVTELGGTVIVPPFDIPVGRMLVVADPQGGTFSLVTLGAAD